ncbi:YggS family pyridoxal phosphate-dependent enzyme [Specibacter cremeus]|uniref:YggS family pyridoxal phosphate-dependent enzyme n=1 Tax=Specibacter cremeus TaxID=1629051 RepID=UPI000F7701A9|nr:YggS family pyridoxal phosphate-dependent enzyme [Specibacter cremeus]
MTPVDPRADVLAGNLARVRERIAAAAAAAPRAAGIAAATPALIVVTKFHPAADVRRLVALGVRDVGENRDKEAAQKAVDVAGGDAVRWHFIGQLQSNKARSVARYAHAVHSVDRLQLVASLGRAMAAEQDATGRADLECFLQVNLDPDADPDAAGRGGALPADVPALADAVARTPGLELAGVMAVAPRGADPDAAFERLARVSAALVAWHPAATGMSAGMSGDLEQAVRWGATHLRVGSDVLGPRPAVG